MMFRYRYILGRYEKLKMIKTSLKMKNVLYCPNYDTLICILNFGIPLSIPLQGCVKCQNGHW